MFESILPNLIQSKNTRFDNPNLISFLDIENLSVAIQKGANNYLYKQLGIKESTSKEVYKKSSDLWNQLISLCEASNKENLNGFYLNKPENLFFVTESNNLIDILDTNNEETKAKFIQKYEEFKLDLTEITRTKKFYTEGKGDLIKVVFYKADYDLVHEPYTPVVLLEANPEKSKYTVYTGILIYSTFTFIPSLNIYNSFDSYSEMIINFSIDNALQYAIDCAQELFNDYEIFKNNQIEISARELMTILNKVGYKLKLNTDNDIDEISEIVEVESNKKIQNFFNTFKFITGETATDIISLNEFRKMLRYNKLTIIDVLEILSREYIKYTGSKITVEILAKITASLYDRLVDKDLVEVIKGDIE